MDRRAIERFKSLLETRQRQLQEGLVQTRQGILAESSDERKDEGDRASAAIANEMWVVQRNQTKDFLADVKAALVRIDDGTFGECLNCGQEIGLKRLEAIPWVRYCITCQELIDHAA